MRLWGSKVSYLNAFLWGVSRLTGSTTHQNDPRGSPTVSAGRQTRCASPVTETELMNAFCVKVSADASPYKNADVLPLPQSRRTWTKRTFVFFWLATGWYSTRFKGSRRADCSPLAINIAEWSGASTACKPSNIAHASHHSRLTPRV